MLLLLDAWLELNFFDVAAEALQPEVAKFSLALGKDPGTTALLLPVGTVSMYGVDVGAGSTDQPVTMTSPTIEQTFKAQGTMWAAKAIAIDFFEVGAVTVDADIHLDWTVVPTDWWTWFTSWNALEAAPDGSLTDGERAYP